MYFKHEGIHCLEFILRVTVRNFIMLAIKRDKKLQ